MTGSRKWMGWGAAVVVVAGGVVILEAASRPASQPPARPQRLATVKLAYPADNLETLDTLDWSGNILLDQGVIFEGLYGYNTKNQIVPKIAQKAVSSDAGRVWTIYLRKPARWSNGKPVTAYDFYYAWMRVLAPSDSNGAVWAGVSNNILNGYAYHSGGVPSKDVGIDVVNPYELRVTLDGSMNIKGLLALSASMPLYPPDVRRHPTDWFDPQYFVGDGPYVVHSFVPNGKLVLTRNRDYVGRRGAFNVGNVKTIVLIPAPTVPVEDYESGALDGVLVTSASDYHYALSHFAGQVHKMGQADINYLGWDHSVDSSPLDNPKVREAIAMAIDRQPIVDPVLNNMVGATTVFAYPGFPTYRLEKNPYSYNVARARRLLSQAGYPHGKGIPQLYLYTQTSTNSPTSVLMGEAVAQQLQTALNLHFKIEPTNSTLFGEMDYGGIEPGVQPGYVIDSGTANWNQTLQWPLQSDQWVTLEDSGTVGSQAFIRYAENWDFHSYDPNDVKVWGNPNDSNLGTSYSQWQPIIRSAKADIRYLTAWTARQPLAYRAALDPPGTIALTTELAQFEASYATAKGHIAKHAAWVSFWKWVGTYPNGGDGGAAMGLNAQVYVDQHEPALEAQMRMWEAELANTASATEAAQLSAKMANAMMASGYIVPLNYAEQVYLEKPDLSGLQSNPWAWGNFYQLQYLETK